MSSRPVLDVGEWLPDQTLRPRWNVVKGSIAPWGAVLSQNAAKYAIIDLGQAADLLGASIESVLSPACVPVATSGSRGSSVGGTSRDFVRTTARTRFVWTARL